MKVIKTIMAMAVLLMVIVSCTPVHEEPYQPTPYELARPSYFPSRTNIPDDNPMTEEGVALGRKLFYDARLSGRDGIDGIRMSLVPRPTPITPCFL